MHPLTQPGGNPQALDERAASFGARRRACSCAPVSRPVRYSLRWYRCAAFSRSSSSLRLAASSSRRRVASAKSLRHQEQQACQVGRGVNRGARAARRRRWQPERQRARCYRRGNSRPGSSEGNQHAAAPCLNIGAPRTGAAWYCLLMCHLTCSGRKKGTLVVPQIRCNPCHRHPPPRCALSVRPQSASCPLEAPC